MPPIHAAAQTFRGAQDMEPLNCASHLYRYRHRYLIVEMTYRNFEVPTVSPFVGGSRWRSSWSVRCLRRLRSGRAAPARRAQRVRHAAVQRQTRPPEGCGRLKRRRIGEHDDLGSHGCRVRQAGRRTQKPLARGTSGDARIPHHSPEAHTGGRLSVHHVRLIAQGGRTIHQTRTGILTGSDQRLSTTLENEVYAVEGRIGRG